MFSLFYTGVSAEHYLIVLWLRQASNIKKKYAKLADTKLYYYNLKHSITEMWQQYCSGPGHPNPRSQGRGGVGHLLDYAWVVIWISI